MKLAVVGSRNFVDYDFLKEKLNSVIKTYKITQIVSGGAKGADSLAKQYANKNQIDIVVYLPEWNKYGKKAGFLRNKTIVDNCDVLCAFWDGISKGTEHSIKLCKKQNKKVIIFNQKEFDIF